MHDESESPERARAWGCGTWALLIGGLVVGTSIVTIMIITASVNRRIDAQLARIREAGEPITTRELALYYEAPPDEEDATQIWLAAMAPFERPAFEAASRNMPILGRNGGVPLPGEPWPELDAVKQFLDDNQRSLDLLHEAAALGGAARYDVDFDLGINMGMQQGQSLRTAARLLRLEVNVRAHEGDARGAANSIHAMFMLARSLENEPTLVSQLIRLAMSGVARIEIGRLLPVIEFTDEDLTRFQADLRAEDFSDGMRRALVGERVIALHSYESMNEQTYGVLGLTRGPDRRLTLEYYEKLVAAAKKPIPQALIAAEAAAAEVDGVSSKSGLNSFLYIMTALLTPTMDTIFAATARGSTGRDATDAAIGVELFRRRDGSLPETLDDLVPDFLPQVPVDPFDGKPLRYLVEPGRYVIYSVGRDGVDDGGIDVENIIGPDIIFEVLLREE